MLTIQALRRSRGITLVDLALLSGIPARTIASIECGIHRLDQRTREELAHIFAVPPETLLSGDPPALQESLRRRLLAEARLAAPVAGAALATALALGPALAALAPRWNQVATTPVARVAPAAAEPSVPPTAEPAPTLAPALGLVDELALADLLGAWPTEVTQPVAAPLDGTLLTDEGAKGDLAPDDGAPYGCPIVPNGRVVVTQGYGVGTHAPAERWGALDLAVDGSGDGRAEVAATQGALVFTPHGGVVRVSLNSWPGGNYVRVTNAATGWATAYAHLDQVFVADGQTLEPGTPVGTVGNTGYSTGAHLHYEIWRNGVNIDPSPYVQCG
jgi:murein DD-endopeptidase MepM/ murein hydrolase activator NlpD